MSCLPTSFCEESRAKKSELIRAAVRRFEGMVMVLHHASTIQPRYQAMMHCGAIRVSLCVSFPSPIADDPAMAEYGICGKAQLIQA